MIDSELRGGGGGKNDLAGSVLDRCDWDQGGQLLCHRTTFSFGEQL